MHVIRSRSVAATEHTGANHLAFLPAGIFIDLCVSDGAPAGPLKCHASWKCRKASYDREPETRKLLPIKRRITSRLCFRGSARLASAYLAANMFNTNARRHQKRRFPHCHTFAHRLRRFVCTESLPRPRPPRPSPMDPRLANDRKKLVCGYDGPPSAV